MYRLLFTSHLSLSPRQSDSESLSLSLYESVCMCISARRVSPRCEFLIFSIQYSVFSVAALSLNSMRQVVKSTAQVHTVQVLLMTSAHVLAVHHAARRARRLRFDFGRLWMRDSPKSRPAIWMGSARPLVPPRREATSEYEE